MTGSKHPPRPEAERAYLSLSARSLRDLLGERLTGVYAGGSRALGDYRPGRNDLDLAAVVEGAIGAELKQAVVARLRHESLPCPARGLELVVYRLETARSATATSDFELNLNSGAQYAAPGPARSGPRRRPLVSDRPQCSPSRSHGTTVIEAPRRTRC
ncbi:MAG: nucleotidyltransferase domain-containing protein [Solirubrobacterales bacterium]